jgi:hypothetical protein
MSFTSGRVVGLIQRSFRANLWLPAGARQKSLIAPLTPPVVPSGVCGARNPSFRSTPQRFFFLADPDI